MTYLDTCLVIYLVERHPLYFPKVKMQLAGVTSPAISPLVEMETLIHPLRTKDVTLQKTYQDFFDCCVSLNMPADVFRHAALLRATHSINTPDALHIATATWHGCNSFWTNDDRLVRTGLPIIRNIL